MNYYNEFDKHAVAWLRELIKSGLIPQGDVDERDIRNVEAADLRGYRQCHFFCGGGGWPYALRLAGIPDDADVWTGSPPCQPWSHANVWQGGGKGAGDDRHLWPELYRLTRKRRPATLFGEQVPGAIGKGWLDEVFGNLEADDYACGAMLLRASSFGASHRRKRLYFVANACRKRRPRHQPLKRIPVAAATAFAQHGDPLAGARSALAGDYSGLLPCDGLSVQLERVAVKVYGNAIVPEVAAAFIQAYCEVAHQPPPKRK